MGTGILYFSIIILTIVARHHVEGSCSPLSVFCFFSLGKTVKTMDTKPFFVLSSGLMPLAHDFPAITLSAVQFFSSVILIAL